MDDNTSLSRVYIQTDAQGGSSPPGGGELRITRVEGEYTLPADLTGWTLLEEGIPCDRLNLAQTHYFPGGLRTADGLCRWKYIDGAATLRTAQEIAADRAALPEPTPSVEADRDALLVDHEFRLTLLELGI